MVVVHQKLVLASPAIFLSRGETPRTPRCRLGWQAAWQSPGSGLYIWPGPVVGETCWQIRGELPGDRRFWLCFNSEDIASGKTITLADPGSDPTLLESFLIDEKRMSLALLVSRLLQRLNGQKWLGGN